MGPHPCQECGEEFESKNQRKRHTREVHQDVAWLTCPGGDKLSVHRNSNGFSCPVNGCHKSFRVAYDLQRHYKRCLGIPQDSHDLGQVLRKKSVRIAEMGGEIRCKYLWSYFSLLSVRLIADLLHSQIWKCSSLSDWYGMLGA